MTDLTEGAVARRVPALTDERLRVLSRRQPVTVPPGTSLADCVRAIQRTGTGDSVFVCDASGRLEGVLTERDIFGRIVVGQVDLSQPVETLMTTEPKTLDLDQTIRDAIELMQTGRYRNVPHRRRVSAAWSASSDRSTSSSTWRSRSRRSCSTSRHVPTSAWGRPKADDDDDQGAGRSRSRSSSGSRSGSPATPAMACS